MGFVLERGVVIMGAGRSIMGGRQTNAESFCLGQKARY